MSCKGIHYGEGGLLFSEPINERSGFTLSIVEEEDEEQDKTITEEKSRNLDPRKQANKAL